MNDRNSEFRPHWHLPREGRLWLLAAAGLFLTGWLKGINLILLLACLLLALWLINLALARHDLRGLRARRGQTGLVFAGTPAVREVEVENAGPFPLTGWWLVDGGPGHHTVWPVGRLDIGQTLLLQQPVVFPRRGRFRGEPLEVRSGFPFGLVEQRLPLAGAIDFVVLPALGELHVSRLQQWLTHATRGDGRSGHALRVPAADAVIQGLRPFRTGDSPRWIHWRTSARRGQLMVREFEDALPAHELLVVVEPSAAVGADLEAEVSLAATVCWEWGRQPRDRLALAVAAPEPVVLGLGSGPDHARRALELLAVLTESEPCRGERLARALPKLPPTAGLLLVHGGTTQRLDDWLGSSLGRRVATLDATDPPDFYTPPRPRPPVAATRSGAGTPTRSAARRG